ncbi:MAG: hypothetical protein OEV28_09420 [Nitrospirota bacterium]|nr:hypothetical protein [Nitrospirota bacterium]
MPNSEAPPRKVFLFSGHMVDATGRPEQRFPADKEPLAAKAIAGALDEIGAGPGDLAMCGGACGGDILFAEACLERGLRLELRIPFDIPTFLEKSVTFAGGNWGERFYRLISHAAATLLIMSDELGPTPADANPYEQDNMWQLESALAWGAERVYFICLWDGKGGDGPGGTRHMLGEVKSRSGNVCVLDTATIFREV